MNSKINMSVTPKKNISMSLISTQSGIGMNLNTVGGTKDHSKLKNLDFDHSGHTGFQREGDYPDEILTNMDIERLLRNFS